MLNRIDKETRKGLTSIALSNAGEEISYQGHAVWASLSSYTSAQIRLQDAHTKNPKACVTNGSFFTKDTHQYVEREVVVQRFPKWLHIVVSFSCKHIYENITRTYNDVKQKKNISYIFN